MCLQNKTRLYRLSNDMTLTYIFNGITPIKLIATMSAINNTALLRSSMLCFCLQTFLQSVLLHNKTDTDNTDILFHRIIANHYHLIARQNQNFFNFDTACNLLDIL